jgi:bifunctional non-homologous end joining protein LigD
MLPYIRDRPATRKRWPEGVGTDKPGPVFFNKDLGAGTPDWVRRFTIQHRHHDNAYPVVNDLATLTWLAQLASLEIHVPQWRFAPDGTPQNPDRLVLDLDPGEGVSLTDCAEVARWAREILSDIGHEPVPVTSGSKGIHLYAPLDGGHTAEDATTLARTLAQALEADHPDQVTAMMKKSERAGKVFIDWSQNNGSKTTVAPYSLRGRAQPWVAAPRTWDELADPGLRQLTYEEVLALVAERGDPLASLHGAPQPDRLATYRSMRDPAKTPEPVPAEPPVPRDGRPTFVIQEHHARRLHYDVRLERDGVLVSWAVPKGPPTDPAVNHLAVQTEDHPMDYATFEGTIPRGEYGGGTVHIWDAGTYDLHKWREGKEVIVTLHGRPGGGLGRSSTFALIHTGGRGDQEARNWLMHRMTSQPTVDVTMPEPIQPMLATASDPSEIPDEENWSFEMKWDGVRVLAYLAASKEEPRRVRLASRTGRDETAAYPDVIADLAAIECESAILDGEIVVLDENGRPRFGLLQNRINLTRPGDIATASRKYPAQLMLFDLPARNGRSLTKEPYETRREMLTDLVGHRPGSRVQVPPTFEGDLAAAMETSRMLQLEGVVAKRRGSIYQPGRRSSTWLKLKHHVTQDVVIGGWRPGNGRRAEHVGSLLVGVPTSKGLKYLGRVGSGLDGKTLDELDVLLAERARESLPFLDVPREDARDARWVEPTLIAEVMYGELTSAGKLRHPVWLRRRTDKLPEDVVWEGRDPLE